jgi:hypothetical protein
MPLIQEKLTKQEKIIIALMRGQHLDKAERETAKERIHVMNLTLKSLYNLTKCS